MISRWFKQLIGLGGLLLGLQLLPASVWAATLGTYAYDVSGGVSALVKTAATGVTANDLSFTGVSRTDLQTGFGNPAGYKYSGWTNQFESNRYVQFSSVTGPMSVVFIPRQPSRSTGTPRPCWVVPSGRAALPRASRMTLTR